MTYILLLCASFLAALVSGAAGFGGSLLLLPIVTAYVGPEISVPVLTVAQLLGLGMGAAMIAGTYAAKHIIGHIPKGKFRNYVAILLFVVGLYMAVTGVN